MADSGFFYRTSRDLRRIDPCRAEIGKDTALTLIEERLNTYVKPVSTL